MNALLQKKTKKSSGKNRKNEGPPEFPEIKLHSFRVEVEVSRYFGPTMNQLCPKLNFAAGLIYAVRDLFSLILWGQTFARAGYYGRIFSFSIKFLLFSFSINCQYFVSNLKIS